MSEGKELKWLTPGDFELDLLTERGERLASIPLGPRDFLPMAHCALKEATALGFVRPGETCRVAGLLAARASNGRGEPAVHEWYLALASPAGELVKVKEFDLRPFAARAFRESLSRELDTNQILFALRPPERPISSVGTMMVVQEIPLAAAPDLSELTLVGESPHVFEPVYIWPRQILERFARFARTNPLVEVLAAVLGRPHWVDLAPGTRVLFVRVKDIVLVPLELSQATAISVNVNRQVVAHIRASKAQIESRSGERLFDLGTLHPHLPIVDETETAGAATGAEARKTASAFFSTSDRATMFTKYYLPYQVAMIWNVPGAGHGDVAGSELAAQFQQWCWSAKATVMPSSGFYLEGEGK